MTQLASRINPPTELEVEAIALNGGLDFTTNKLQVDKGTLLDCLNYEVVDKLGYQEVAGFSRFDGRVSPDQLEFFYFKVSGALGSTSIGKQVKKGGVLFGVTVDILSADSGSNAIIVYARYNTDVVISTADTITLIEDDITTFTLTTLTGQANYSNYTSNLASNDAEGLYSRLQGLNEVLRDRIASLHDTPIGLHWYRDKLYAVVDEQRLAFNSGGTTEITPNMVVRQAGVCSCRILSVTLNSGTWAGGDASGTFLVEVISFAFGANRTIPTSGNFDLFDEDTDLNITTNVFTARALTSSDELPSSATIWRSKPEDELDSSEATYNYGWERISPGWEVSYIEGYSETDSFRKVERSIDNNFTYSEGDEEGLPVGFQHGAIINNLVPSAISAFSPAIGRVSEGFPGWRESGSTTTFVENTDHIVTDDTDYIYGDVWGQIGGSAATNPYLSPEGEDGVYDVSIAYGTPSSLSPVISNPLIATARAPLVFYNFGELLAGLDRDAVISGFEITCTHDIDVQYDGGVPDPFTGNSEDFVVPNIAAAVKLYAALVEYDVDTGEYTYRGGLRSSPAGVSSDPADWTTNEGAASGGQIPVEGTFSDTAITTVIGGTGNTFSLDNISIEDLESGKYSIAVFAKVDAFTTTGGAAAWTDFTDVRFVSRVKLDKLDIKVYYTEPSARYYITDDASSPTNVLSADLVSYVVASGALSNRTGAGTFQFTNIQTVLGGKTTILKGDTIHPSDTITTANILAKVDDNAGADTGEVGMVLNGLPTRQDLIDASSRYQFITANFYARDDWDGFYGVSGAGKAFSFGEFTPQVGEGLQQYLTKITTNTITDEDDKPRHVAFHSYCLALGFRDGVVRFSVPGEPENFSGTDGAAEIGVGDKVVGLLSMVGTTLGVFCENSIHSIVGTSADTFQAQVLAPYSGALEYTVVDMGIPVYCDTRGISTLEQSQKYGNFQGVRLSAKVSPWILPRMTRSLDLFSLNQGAGVVCAVPVRSKNQYRLFFRDGKVLVMTMNADGSNAFTFSQYYLEEDDTTSYFVPFAHSSQVDENGKERIHMSHYSPHSSAESDYVFEFESGFGFDLNWFPAYFTTNWHFRNPFKSTNIRKVRADGLTKGLGYGRITVGVDYDENSYAISDQDFSLPPNPSSSMLTDFRPTTTMASVMGTGRALSLKVFKDEEETTLHPPVCYQVLLTQYQAGGKADA